MAAKDWLDNTEAGVARSVRSSQVAMTNIIEKVFMGEEPSIAFIEAPTGVGKSYAHLIPSILSGKRIVISTGKKALQTQFVEKDLPFLTSKIKAVKYAQLKGKNNYCCKLRVMEQQAAGQFNAVNDEDVAMLEDWLARTTTGDLSTLPRPFILEPQIRVAECVRKVCPHLDSCGYVKSKEAAKAAEIVVVNHALLAYDLSVGGGKVLGDYNGLVIDEAHEAPRYFREAFSLRLNHRQPDTIQRVFEGTEFEAHDVLGKIYEAIFKELPAEGGALNVTSRLRDMFTDLYVELDFVHARLKNKGLLDDDEDGVPTGASDAARQHAKLKSGAIVVDKGHKAVEILLGKHINYDEEGEVLGRPTEYIAYVERRGRELPEIVVTPVEVGPLVAPSLLHIGRVVVTSATLATPAGMAYMAREFGLHHSQIQTQVTLTSPFNFAAKSAAYISNTSPPPTDKSDVYYDKMAAEIHELLAASKGGAFVLCASYVDMTKLYEAVRANHHPLPYRVAQQSGAPEALLDWFKKTPRAVLFGVKTFWAGVDIQGLGLRLVIIPRLPFPNFGDPVLRARKQRVIDAHMEQGVEESRASMMAWDSFDFQEAMMELKQGVGRLIRSETDMGVVALLDRRAATVGGKAYGAKIRAALPMPVYPDKAKILKFLEKLASVAEAT